MEKTNFSKKTGTKPLIHHGENIKRLRVLLGIRQKEMADGLGGTWTQAKISLIESTAIVQKEFRQEIAHFFKVDIALLNNFSVESARLFLEQWTVFDQQLTELGKTQTLQLLKPVSQMLAAAVKALNAEIERVNEIYELLHKEQMRFGDYQVAIGKAHVVKELAISPVFALSASIEGSWYTETDNRPPQVFCAARYPRLRHSKQNSRYAYPDCG